MIRHWSRSSDFRLHLGVSVAAIVKSFSTIEALYGVEHNPTPNPKPMGMIK
jgi:hypothetical protein